MKWGRFALAIGSLVVCGGCGSGGQGGINSRGTAGGGTPSGTPVFVTNTSGSVSTYSLNTTTGALQTTNGSPLSTGGSSPDSLAVDPARAHLLVSNLASGTTAVFSISSSTGALQPIAGSPFTTSLSQVRILVHPSGNFLYALMNSPSQLNGFNYSSTTGAITPLAGFPVSLGFPGASGLAITSDGRLLFASNPTTNQISSFSINSGTGSVTPLGTISGTGGAPSFLILDSTNTFLFGLNGQGNTVSVFSISTMGTLTEVSGSPFLAGATPVSGVFSGGFLFVANQNGGTMSVLKLNTATGQLAPVSGSPFAAGSRPTSVSISGNAQFLIVTSSNGSGGVILVFAIGAGGVLTPVVGSPFTPDAQTSDQVIAL